MLSHRIVRSHERGELLFQQGDPATCCSLVLDGWVKLYRQTTDGNEVVVSLFTVGESFAEAMMFCGGRYPATAEVVTSARILHIDGQLLRDAILRDPQISFDMLAASSMHLRRLVEQVEQLKAQSAPKRIASFLLSLTAARCGPVRIELPYEKLLIANRLRMKPESFSRALRQLRGTGVVVEREFIRIDDVARLSAFIQHEKPTVFRVESGFPHNAGRLALDVSTHLLDHYAVAPTACLNSLSPCRRIAWPCSLKEI